jgi:peptidoglycan/LPS O-acetylase OafA/YrhL
MTTRTVSPGRIPSLDALRFVGVLAVVALHAGAAYSTVIPWWYVGDPDKSRLVDFVLAIWDGFTMPLLFAVAGYVALPSLARHGVAGFVAGKVRRLLVPLVGLTLLYCPVIAYVDFLDKGGRGGFFAHWLALLPSAADWRYRLFSAAAADGPAQDVMWPFHLWFLAVLFLFCLGLAGWRLLVGPGLTQPAAGGRAGWGWFGLAALAVGVAAGLGQLSGPDVAWARVGPFLAFEPKRLPLYAGFFLLGTYAWRRGWFVAHAVPGRAWAWGLGAVVLLILMVASRVASITAGPGGGWFAFSHGLAQAGFALAVTGLLAVVMDRTRPDCGWRRPGFFAVSFDLYLLHFPPVILLQYGLVGSAVPIAVKYGLCFGVPTAVCLGLGRLLGRHRRLLTPIAVAATCCFCLAVWP